MNENGYVYVSIPNALNPHFEYEDPLNHTCNYNKNNIVDLFAKNNFKKFESYANEEIMAGAPPLG